jgi:enolase
VTAIAQVFAWEALDSRGTPTVACEVRLESGARGTAVVPSGASTGRHEAYELRDGGPRYGGRGVLRAVEHVNAVAGPAVVGLQPAQVDAELRALDGTPDLERLGANAVLAMSIAAALADADAAGEPLYRLLGEEPLLPLPMVNILSGGAHAGRVGDVQDFLVVPVGAASFAEAIEWAWRVRSAAAAVLHERGLAAALVADEGGFGPALGSSLVGFDVLATAIERAGLDPASDVALAVDLAASQLVAPGGYRFAADDRTLATDELLRELERWCDTYPIVSLEDPLAEDDWDGWLEATRRLGDRVQLIGDDLFATSVDRVRRGLELGAANALLVKPNQAGTLSAAAAALDLARNGGYATIVSARSGDTEDSWLADLAVGWAAGQIKVGSLARSERTAKWNRLLRIEAELGDRARYAGAAALSTAGAGPPTPR